MSHSSIPSSLTTTRLIAGMSIRRAWRGRLIWLTGLCLLLPVATSAMALASGNGGIAFFEKALDAYLRFLTPFLMALYASSSVAEEVQAKTITYLLSRPMTRWALPVGKYLGSLATTLVMFCVSLVLVYLLTMLGETDEFFAQLPTLLRGLLSLALAVVLFGAVACAFGTMVSSYPFVVTLLYVLLVDVGFSFVPGWFKLVAMTVHLRALAGLYHPAQSMFVSDPQLSPGVALLVLLTVTVTWLLIAISWVNTTEYRTDK